MAKVMTTPIMALLQFAFYGKRFSLGILATLGVVCVGVCLATATEITLTLVGFSIALAACFVTAIYSIVRKQCKYSIKTFVVGRNGTTKTGPQCHAIVILSSSFIRLDSRWICPVF